MKVKYSGTPFHHFKCGIIVPGIIELDDEWAQRLIEAGIVKPLDYVGAGSSRVRADPRVRPEQAQGPIPTQEIPTDVGSDPCVRPEQAQGPAPIEEISTDVGADPRVRPEQTQRHGEKKRGKK